MERVVVAVCSQEPLTLLGVEELLRGEDSVTVVAPKQMAQAHVALIAADELDALSLDLVGRVARSSSARVVLVVDQLRDADLPTLMRCRVVKVIARQAVTTQLLLDTVRDAAHSVLPDATARLADQLERVSHDLLTPRSSTAALLAPRERAMLRLLADGLDTAEIADQLAYSERTVKNIVHGLLARLGLRNRAHAVAYAMRSGVF